MGKYECLESKLDSIAREYNVPDYKPYILTIVPEDTDDGYIQNGGSHVIIGMEYEGHMHGLQVSLGSVAIKHRTLLHGVWREWKSAVLS